MVRTTSSVTGPQRMLSRPIRLTALAGSATLVTCWAIAVGAGQANPAATKVPKPLPPVPSSTQGKSTGAGSQSPTPSVGDKPQIGSLVLSDGMLDQQTNIATGHNFIYTVGNTVLKGDNVRYDNSKGKGKGILDADSHLIMDDPEHHATGQKAHVEETKTLAVLTGDIVMTLKPQTASASSVTGNETDNIDDAKRQGAVVTCDQVDSYYKKKFHILHGHLVFKQHILQTGKPALDRTGTAEHAEYDAKKEVLVLFPPVHVEDSDGKKFDSEQNNVIVITKKGQENVTGKGLIISFPVDTSKDEGDDEPSAPAKTDTGKPDTAKPGAAPPPKDTSKPDANPDAKKDEKKDGKP